MAERWYLYRSKEEPWVGVFESREAAEEWRDDHPSLLDWQPAEDERKGEPGAEEHLPVCGACGNAWPCQAHQDATRMARELWRIERACAHCGKTVENGQMSLRVEGHGVFHGRKGPCRRAAEKLSVEASVEVVEPDPRDIAR